MARDRSSEDKLRECLVSVTDYMTPAQRSDALTGAALVDCAGAINSALRAYAESPGVAKVLMPSGKYRIESTVTVPEHVRLVGESGDPFGAGEPGCELAWYGASGSVAVQTSTDDENDWSRGGIEGVRIKNYTATSTGDGLHVRNPQNGSYLRNVTVSGFPKRGCYVYEVAGRASAGTAGFFSMDEGCFFVGGETPLEIQATVQQIMVQGFGVDTDANSLRAILLTKGPAGSVQRAPVKLLAGKVEIQSTSDDIDGIVWDQDIPVSFDTVAVQRNNDVTSTKAAFRFTGTTRSIPRAEFHNCTTWNLKDKLKLDQAGLSLAAAAITTPESFSFSRTGAADSLSFGRETLTAGMSSQAVYAMCNANVGAQGFVVSRPAIIAGVSARYTALIVADTITISIVKNATFAVSLALNSSNQSRFADYFGESTAINDGDFLLAPGDRLVAQVTTGGSLSPTSGHLIVSVLLRYVG